MNFEELKALLTAPEGLDNDKILEGVQGLINAEKQKGITEYQKKDGELLKLKNFIKESGFDSDRHGTLKEYIKSISTKAANSDNDKVTINSLTEKLNELTETFATSQRVQKEATEKANTESLRSVLTSELGSKVFGAGFIIDNLLRKGDVKKVDGKDIFSVDGVDLDLKTGINKFLENNRDIVRSTPTDGRGVPVAGADEHKDYADMSNPSDVQGNMSEMSKEFGIEI